MGPGRSLWNDRSGGSTTEYALTLAIIGGCVACTAIGLGYAIGLAMNTMTGCLESHNGSCAPQIAAGDPTPEPLDPIPAVAAPIPSAAAPIPAAAAPTPAAAPAKGKPDKGKKPNQGCPSTSCKH